MTFLSECELKSVLWTYPDGKTANAVKGMPWGTMIIEKIFIDQIAGKSFVVVVGHNGDVWMKPFTDDVELFYTKIQKNNAEDRNS